MLEMVDQIEGSGVSMSQECKVRANKAKESYIEARELSIVAYQELLKRKAAILEKHKREMKKDAIKEKELEAKLKARMKRLRDLEAERELVETEDEDEDVEEEEDEEDEEDAIDNVTECHELVDEAIVAIQNMEIYLLEYTLNMLLGKALRLNNAVNMIKIFNTATTLVLYMDRCYTKLKETYGDITREQFEEAWHMMDFFARPVNTVLSEKVRVCYQERLRLEIDITERLFLEGGLEYLRSVITNKMGSNYTELSESIKDLETRLYMEKKFWRYMYDYYTGGLTTRYVIMRFVLSSGVDDAMEME